MQSAIGPTDSSTASNPLLDVWTHIPTVVDDGTGATISILSAPASLAWSIQAMTTEAQAQSPIEVAAGVVNLVTDLIGGVVGHYAAKTAPAGLAPWVMPGMSPPPLPFGRYQIVWTSTTPDFVMRREFDLIQGGVPFNLAASCYATPSDLRDEGVLVSDASDLRLLRSLKNASKYIEMVTERFFEPRYFRQTTNGSGARASMYGDPIIAIAPNGLSLGNPVQSTIGLGSLRMYNRHLTERLTNPDDRDDPKLEFVHMRDLFGRQRSASIDSPLFGVPFRDLFFPAGVQNVNTTALWGYTDWDGSSQGETPYQIRHACKLIAAREMWKLMDDERDTSQKRPQLSGERTREQSYTLQRGSERPYTNDPAIDDILLYYRRPIHIGSP